MHETLSFHLKSQFPALRVIKKKIRKVNGTVSRQIKSTPDVIFKSHEFWGSNSQFLNWEVDNIVCGKLHVTESQPQAYVPLKSHLNLQHSVTLVVSRLVSCAALYARIPKVHRTRF